MESLVDLEVDFDFTVFSTTGVTAGESVLDLVDFDLVNFSAFSTGGWVLVGSEEDDDLMVDL